MSGNDAQHAPANCENCDTPLQGQYCHECGQSVHSPTRHFGHAVEEFFEAFWHLDGRVFRTLRDLMVPGRVAVNYLSGKRVRYIAPLRLFVILSLLTFFVGKLVVHVDEQPLKFGGEGGARIERAQTVEEVRRIEDELLKELSVAEDEAAKVPGVNAALVATRARIQGAAASRIVELQKAAAPSQDATPAKAAAAASGKTGPNVADKNDKKGALWRSNGRAWDEQTNPVDTFLPAFADRWINHKMARATENLEHMDGNANRFLQAFLGAVPTALFLLMPVFALLLKVLYIGSGRRYLEHMVVALYSHAWLLLVLLAMFLLNALTGATPAMWMSVTSSLVQAVLWCWVPVYLFVMQHRVYRSHWALTLVRYLAIGTIYMVLVTMATVFAVFAGIAA